MKFDFSSRVFLFVLLLSPFTLTPIQVQAQSEWTGTIDGEWKLTFGGGTYTDELYHHADITFTVSNDGFITGRGTGWEQFRYTDAKWPQGNCDSGRVDVTFSIDGTVSQENLAYLKFTDIVPQELPCSTRSPFNNYLNFQINLNDGTTFSPGPPAPISLVGDVPDGYDTLLIHGSTVSDTIEEPTGGTQGEQDFGGYSSWDEYCKATHGDSYYDAENNICVILSDQDSDNDAIDDSVDQCIGLLEDYYGENDQDGCPEYDSDSDSDKIYDSIDNCVFAPEDTVGDTDGCPKSEKDLDGDSFYNDEDSCPLSPEDYVGLLEGCPDEDEFVEEEFAEEEFAEPEVLEIKPAIAAVKTVKGTATIKTPDGKVVNTKEVQIGQTIQTGNTPGTNIQIDIGNGNTVNLKENTQVSPVRVTSPDGEVLVIEGPLDDLKQFEWDDELVISDLKTKRPDLFDKHNELLAKYVNFVDEHPVAGILGTFVIGATAGLISLPATITVTTLYTVGLVLVAGSVYFSSSSDTSAVESQSQESFAAYALDEQNQDTIILTRNGAFVNENAEFIITEEDGTTKLNVLDGEVQFVPFDGSTPMTIDSGNSLSVSADKIEETSLDTASIDRWWDVSAQESQPKSGGCIIATTTYGSELAPQVQFLREIRDNTVLSTASGTSFMTTFNSFYYSFSPTVADLERQNPVFKEAVKITITPLLSSLSLLQYVDIDSEVEMLGYGIGIILLNIGMYFVAPAIIILKFKPLLRIK